MPPVSHPSLTSGTLFAKSSLRGSPWLTHWPFRRSIIHTDLKPENVLLDLPPRPPPDSEQPPPLQGRVSRAGITLKGVATTIEDLNTALSLADQNGMSAEEKRKLKKKVRAVTRRSRSSSK